jgi:hypothetical protein
MTVLLFGDSHSDAVRRAVQRRLANGQSAPLSEFRRLKVKNGITVGDLNLDDFLRRISSLTADDVVISMVGGGQYTVFSTVQHAEPFDFYNCDGTGISDPEAAIIPYQVLLDLVSTSVIHGLEAGDGKIRGDGTALEAMQSATQARIVHILPPPPVKDSQAIQRRHEERFALQGISSFGVSSAQLRLKFWSLQATVLHQFCRDRGIELIGPPADALVDGFLRPEYHHGGAHANERYGELLLRYIEANFTGTSVRSAAGAPNRAGSVRQTR